MSMENRRTRLRTVYYEYSSVTPSIQTIWNNPHVHGRRSTACRPDREALTPSQTHNMLRLVVLAMTLVLTPPALAQDNRLSEPAQQLQLENGLTVILHQDSSTTIVGRS